MAYDAVRENGVRRILARMKGKECSMKRFEEMNVTKLQGVEGGMILPVLPSIGVELGIKVAMFVAKLFANS